MPGVPLYVFTVHVQPLDEGDNYPNLSSINIPVTVLVAKTHILLLLGPFTMTRAVSLQK